MYIMLTKIYFLNRLTSMGGIMFSKKSCSRFQFLRSFSGLQEKTVEDSKESSNQLSFTKYMQNRQNEADRSLVIKIKHEKVIQEVLSWCKKYGEVLNFFYFQAKSDKFVLAEMKSEKDLQGVLECDFEPQKLTYKNVMFVNFHGYEQPLKSSTVTLPLINSKVNLYKRLREISKDYSVSEQLTEIFDNLKLNEVETRFRFLMCRQINVLLSGVLPESKVYPFGSSVSTFGISGCDLDLVVLPFTSKNNKLPYISMVEPSVINRETIEKHLQIICKLIENFATACKVTDIFRRATVPIIKFTHENFLLDCDLSLYVASGVEMTRILYDLSSLDERVSPLILIIKIWSEKLKLNRDLARNRLTSFKLTMLVIFFLQQNLGYEPILPPIHIFLSENNGLLDDAEIEDALSIFKKNRQSNSMNLESLLLLFFNYYKKFDFSRSGCCVGTGEVVNKTVEANLLLINPLTPSLNIGRNVAKVQLNNFQACARIAAYILRTSPQESVIKNLLNPNLYSHLDSSRISFQEIMSE